MRLAMIGLGRMGANMVRRLLHDKHDCVVFDRDSKTVEAMTKEGATGSTSLADLISKLPAPRTVWVMLPAGAPTESTLEQLRSLLQKGDTVIDGGNTLYKDDRRRAIEFDKHEIDYLDVGTSGGVWGLEKGYCLMIGGKKETYQRLEPIFQTLAPGADASINSPKTASGTAEKGYLYCGPSGSGHFVKMIHNGIEYGMMQAYAEGFDLMKRANLLPESADYQLPLADIAEVWRHGSVVRSWLLDLAADALAKDETLKDFSGNVSDSGEGRWTVEAAIESATPAEVLTAALFTRFRSRQDHTFAEKVLSALRLGFGGHKEK